MKNSDWKTFVEKTKGVPPKPLLVEALSYCDGRDEALDLGAGALGDSIFLLSQGFRHVTAVDQENHVQDLINSLPADRFQFVESSFEEFDFPDSGFDLVNAQYALPFTNPQSFDEVFGRIIASLKQGGVFVGQLFGPHDSWNTKDAGMSFHSKQEAENLLSQMKVIKLDEKEVDGITVSGETKHWHLFDVIAQM